MNYISIDIETFSSIDLKKCGVYKYVESDDFEILLFSYSIDGSEIITIDLAMGEVLPDFIVNAISDENIIKTAYNATFERICLSKHLGLKHGQYLNPKSWECTLVWAATLGLPLSLEGVGIVLGLDKKKMSEGKQLIRYFSMPCLPTNNNGGRTRNYPIHDLEKWQLYKKYNARDVEVELGIQNKLKNFPVPENIWEEYYLSEEINDRGILVDMDFVNNAIDLDAITKEKINDELIQITCLENPNSVLQMREWLSVNGLELDSLGKKEVAEVIKTAPDKLAKVLKLRQLLAKTSVKKYQAMKNAVCKDSRVRGMFQFYGANRTARFSGRIVQLQNLPQNHMTDLEQVRELVKQGNFDAVNLLYDNVPNVLSELIRTAFIPPNNKKFIVSDFAAIEARVIAWLAGEKWRIKAFADGEDIYCASASMMFGIPVVKGGVNSDYRQKGKQAELACGYQGSTGALIAMGALEMGLKEDELKPLVDSWRKSNPNIVRLWYGVDDAVKQCVKERVTTNIRGIKFSYKSGFLFITLPSGRKLAYVKPRIGENRFGGESVTYEGVGLNKKWERLESYGGKFVENIVQAIARDLLVYSLSRLKDYKIVAHVHDEIVIEVGKDIKLGTITDEMNISPEWAKDLLLRADGFECEFYKKD